MTTQDRSLRSNIMSKAASSSSSSSSSSPKAAKTLDGRLLCAAALAYEIREPYLSGAGFPHDSAPQRVSTKINSCLIGTSQDGIVIAFRGTTTEALDWLQNTDATLMSGRDSNSPSNGVIRRIPEGRVHKGFYNALYNKGLSQEISKILFQLLPSASCNRKGWPKNNVPKNCKIYLTGHSKGGSLASLFAVELLQCPKLPNPEYVCTFGAARLGDTTFADYFQRNVQQTSYENQLDIVPFLPSSPKGDCSSTIASLMEDLRKEKIDTDRSRPKRQQNVTKRGRKRWEYAPIGNRKFISAEGRIVLHVGKDLDRIRIQEIEGKTILRLSEFRQAHCSTCPNATSNCQGGYFKALAPEICASS